ncbi:MAG: hypothetical protein WKF30_14675 [Pyrinomonadaceae bacterium]
MLKQIFLSLVALTSLCVAQAAAQNNLPPLVDREIFFGNPEIAGAQISPDGKFISFRKPHKDTMNIWVKRADEPFERARLVTNETKHPIRNSFWSRDGKYILFVNDFGGDEISTSMPSIQLPFGGGRGSQRREIYLR